MPVSFSDPVTCCYSTEDSGGNEKMFFGSTNGYVYQMDKGTSFDGDNKESYLIFHFNFSKALRFTKKYLDVTFETYGTGYTEFSFTYELGYASTLIPQPDTITSELSFSSVYWDQFVWDQFVWDGVSLSPSTIKLNGSAENISLIIQKNSDYFERNNFNGAHLRYLMRRLLRNA